MKTYKFEILNDVVTSSVGDHRGNKTYMMSSEPEKIACYFDICPSGKPFHRLGIIYESETGNEIHEICSSLYTYLNNSGRVTFTGEIANEFEKELSKLQLKICTMMKRLMKLPNFKGEYWRRAVPLHNDSKGIIAAYEIMTKKGARWLNNMLGDGYDVIRELHIEKYGGCWRFGKPNPKFNGIIEVYSYLTKEKIKVDLCN